MHNNLVLVTYLLINEKAVNIRSLVTGKLNDITILVIVSDGAVALECLLQVLGDLLGIQISSQALNDGNALSAVTLLDSQMNLRSILLLYIDIKVLYNRKQKHTESEKERTSEAQH